MNAKIMQALIGYDLELSTICLEYFCKNALTTREYNDKKYSALRRCVIKIKIAIEDEMEKES